MKKERLIKQLINKKPSIVVRLLISVLVLILVILALLILAFIFHKPITGYIIINNGDYTGTGYAVPQGFNITPEYFTLSPTNQIINISVNVTRAGGFVYKIGYFYNAKINDWVPFTFPQSTISGSNWISENASTILNLNASDNLREDYNYIVVYSCKKSGSDWICGCESGNSGAACNLWMLQIFSSTNVINATQNSTTCAWDYDCGTGKICVNRTCSTLGCVNSSSCGAGRNCVSGACVSNVSAINAPDFVVSAITVMPVVLTQGGNFTVNVTIVNQGTVAGDASVLQLWLNRYAVASAGESGDSAKNVGVLAAGANTTLTFSGLTAPNLNGTFYVRAFVNAAVNGTNEQSTTNNQKTWAYTFVPLDPSVNITLPDFLITSISFSPTTLTRGINFTAYVTIINNAAFPGDAGYLDVYTDRTSIAPNGTLGSANQHVGIMLGGEIRMLTFTNLIAPSSMGTHTFRAFIDSRGITAEQSEGNNQKTKTYGFY